MAFLGSVFSTNVQKKKPSDVVPLSGSKYIAPQLEDSTLSKDNLLAQEVQILDDSAVLTSEIFSVSGDNGYQTTAFSDEWARSHEKTNEKEFIDTVNIKDLTDINKQVIYDEIKKDVFLEDQSLAITTPDGCFLPGTNGIYVSELVDHAESIKFFDKVTNFGKIYDFQFKQVSLGQYKFGNASLCTAIANAFGYLSFDKLLNDEIILKKKQDKLNAECPEVYPAYSGFLVSKDYLDGGWIDIDQVVKSVYNDQNAYDDAVSLSIRTKRFTEAKRIAVNFVLNYTSSIVELNGSDKLTDFGARIKDKNNNQVFDYVNVRNDNLACVGNQVVLGYMGKVNDGAVSTETVSGSSTSIQACEKILINKCTGEIVKVRESNGTTKQEDGISHTIMPQFRLNPLIEIREKKPEILNTIDPIHWTTGIQDLEKPFDFSYLKAEFGENEYTVGQLNQQRAFGMGGGTIEQGFVYGGIFHGPIRESSLINVTTDELEGKEGWGIIGDTTIQFTDDLPGSSTTTIGGSFAPCEIWNGTAWTIDNRGALEGKAMGLGGGGSHYQVIALGASTASFNDNGVISSLVPSNKMFIGTPDGWENANIVSNVARVSPAGFMRIDVRDPSNVDGNVDASATCKSTIDTATLMSLDRNAANLGDDKIYMANQAQIELGSFFQSFTGGGTSNRAVVASAVGFAFGGYVGCRGLNVNPFGFDKVYETNVTNSFEYVNKVTSKVITETSSTSAGGASTSSTHTFETGAWMVDPTRNYPVKTMGTCYVGSECAGIACGGKSSVSVYDNVEVNAFNNIKYGYFDDERYSEFNNSVLNLAYEYNGVTWIRRDNLVENVAFHAGVGDEMHAIYFGGVHASVEKIDISVSFPGCEDWISTLESFNATWHRHGTIGLDREKRYAAFGTRYDDKFGNTYYKVGDKRDLFKSGVVINPSLSDKTLVYDISGVNTALYITNPTNGHKSFVTYVNKNQDRSIFDVTMFQNGESWVGKAITYENLSNGNPSLPYAEREAALEFTDQVGFYTKTLFSDVLVFDQTYKPDSSSDPSTSVGISAFPALNYFANKNNGINIAGQYYYAGHNSTGGMWLWSRPTAGEELFHPSNIHDKPTWYTDDCGIAHISGNWQSYNKWIDHSFKNHTGLHSVVYWATRQDCSDYQDQQILGSVKNTEDNIKTTRYYRWTQGNFTARARRLAPNGKIYSCLSTDIASDKALIDYLGIADDSRGTESVQFSYNTPISSSQLVSLSGYSSICNSPIDLFNKAWFVPVLHSPSATGEPLPVYYASDYFANFTPVNDVYYPTTHISVTGTGSVSLTGSYMSFPGGFFPLTSNANCSCDSWFNYAVNSAAISAFGLSDKMVTHAVSGAGFFYKHNNAAPYLDGDIDSFYFNKFPTVDCSGNNLTWNFIVPNEVISNSLYDSLSFGLPAAYTKPKNLTYSFYITREGQGLDQLFYGKARNKFVERWQFPHVDVVNEVIAGNGENPFIIDSDGSGNYIPLAESISFKAGSLSVGEFLYPEIDNDEIEKGTINTTLIEAIKSMTISQAVTGAVGSVTGCNFDSLQNWINRSIEDTNTEVDLVSYYPMTYDNFSGPTGANSYFITMGADLQHQFAVNAAASSSAIRDRACLWPWCDLLDGKATNAAVVGKATWYYEPAGYIWTAEVLSVESINPGSCFDRTKSFDPLKRKITNLIIEESYPDNFLRETFVIKKFDKKGEKLIEYKIIYDNASGPEITTGRTGFEYNIFGTDLKPRTIDRSTYNNKPLAGPTQEWVSPDDEKSSVMSFDWNRTVMAGISGVSEDAYPWNHGTVCDLVSGGYNRFNIENAAGYFCKLAGEEDIWIYSVPNSSKTTVGDTSGNFFVDQTPFALVEVLSGSANGMIPVHSELYSCVTGASGADDYDCGYGMEIVRSQNYSTATPGALISTVHIVGPHAFGMGLYGYGKSQAYGRSLVWSGDRTSCTYDGDAIQQIPSTEELNKAWPWNVIGFDGLLGPRGYTDAVDTSGNYWMAIGDINNTIPFTNGESTLTTQAFKNQYTIIKVASENIESFMKTVLAGTNYKDYLRNYLPSECITGVDLINDKLNGARYREAILEALNMPQGQVYYDLYIKLIQENVPDLSINATAQSKASFNGAIEVELPLEPLNGPIPEVKQKLDVVSQFDIRCVDCVVCDDEFVIDSPTASKWTQHNHDEYIAPFLDSPFAGPFNLPGFNIWLTVGGEPRWGTAMWATVKEGKVWINYRRQKLQVNEYRGHLVLAMITASIAIEDFGEIDDIRKESGNSYAQVPVYVNYDEFIFCLDDYRNTDTIQKILNNESNYTANSYDCTDNVVVHVTDNFNSIPTHTYLRGKDSCDGRPYIIDISGNMTLATCISGETVYTGCGTGITGTCFDDDGIIHYPCYTVAGAISAGSYIASLQLDSLNNGYFSISGSPFNSGYYAIQYNGVGAWSNQDGDANTWKIANTIRHSGGTDVAGPTGPSANYLNGSTTQTQASGYYVSFFHTGGNIQLHIPDGAGQYGDNVNYNGGVKLDLYSLPTITICPTGSCMIQGITGGLCERSTWVTNSSPDETYTEWGTSFIQEYRKYTTDCDIENKISPQKYYFTYDVTKNYDSNTYISECITTDVIKDYDWRRYQDGVGLGGDAPLFSGFTQKQYQCNRFSEWLVGQIAFGTVSQAIVVGGYAIQGDGELHKSKAPWESITVDTTFKWNTEVIQPEDTLNINYKYRNFSPFFTNGMNSIAKTSLGVTLYDVSAGAKVERQGSVKMEGSKETKITFDDPIPDYVSDKYSIVVTTNENVKIWWEDKSNSGFTIKAEVAITGYIDWQIFALAKIPGSVIDTIDDQETFSQFENL